MYLPDVIGKDSHLSAMLQYEEYQLTLEEGCVNGSSSCYVYKVIFSPEFTYNTGFIYVIDEEEDLVRSAKYYRNCEDACNAAIEFMKESV